MGCVPTFATAIAIPIHPMEKNRNRIRHRLINHKCEWDLKAED